MGKKVLNFLKSYIKKENIYIMFLSYLLAFCMFSYVNEFIYKMLPEVKITIASYEPEKNEGIEENLNYIALLEDDNTSKFYKLRNIFDENRKLKENTEGFNYINVGDYGYNLNSIHMNNPKNKVTIKMKKMPNSKILFYNIGTSKKILLESKKGSKILDMSKIKEGDIYSYYPFTESKEFLLYASFVYLFLGILIFILLNIIKKYLGKLKIPKYFLGYNPKHLTMIIYIVISVYVSYKFISNTLPKSLFFIDGSLYGDQNYYWEIGTIIKNFDWIGLQNKTVTFRGYFSSILPALALLIGKIIRVSPLWIFYMLNNVISASLLGYIIPELYNRFNPKKVKNYQIMLLFITFFIFWKGLFYTVTADIMGVTFLLYSILLFLKGFYEKKNTFIFFSGICLSIAISNRGNYIIVIYFVLILCVLSNVLKYFFREKNNLKNSCFIFFFLGVFIITIPQIKINYDGGHIGIFPYETEKSWHNYRLTDVLSSHALNKIITGPPYVVVDAATQKISENFGIKEEIMAMNQTLTAYAKTPFVSIITVIKKIFLLFDIKTPETYPWYSFSMHTNFYLFSFLNYFIISTVFYILGNKKIRTKFFKKEELILISGSILLALPSLIFTIEWRYYILNYLIIYSIFCFKSFNFFRENKIPKDGYLKFVISFICIASLISSNYYY